ncbi:hypothetical protein [Streptomyces sp. NPDC059814]|uniref:hypothetical protein n=1 Tax=Streptomyces sp. NPDC059814 TaxID=3346959 RepID=UPI00365E95BB
MTHPSHPSAYPQQPHGEPHTVPFPVQQQWVPAGQGQYPPAGQGQYPPADVRHPLPPATGAAVPAPAKEQAAAAPNAGGRDP